MKEKRESRGEYLVHVQVGVPYRDLHFRAAACVSSASFAATATAAVAILRLLASTGSSAQREERSSTVTQTEFHHLRLRTMIGQAVRKQVATQALRRELSSSVPANLLQRVAAGTSSAYYATCAGTVATLATISAVCAADLSSQHVKRGRLQKTSNVFHDQAHFR